MSDQSGDAITRVETAADLAVVPGRDAETVATLLSEGAPGVVWVQAWLAGEKDLSAAENHPQVFVGQIEDYSAKAFKVTQRGSENSAYVPKSASEAFVLADGTDAVATPQRGLDSFEADP